MHGAMCLRIFRRCAIGPLWVSARFLSAVWSWVAAAVVLNASCVAEPGTLQPSEFGRLCQAFVVAEAQALARCYGGEPEFYLTAVPFDCAQVEVRLQLGDRSLQKEMGEKCLAALADAD